MNSNAYKAIRQAQNIVWATNHKLDISHATKDIMQRLVTNNQVTRFLIKVKSVTYITTYNKKSIPVLIANVIYKHRLIARNILIQYNKQLAYVGECWANDWLYIKGRLTTIQIAPQEQRYIITNITNALFSVGCPFRRIEYTYPKHTQVHYFYLKQPRRNLPTNLNLLLGYTILVSTIAVRRPNKNGRPVFSQYLTHTPLMKYAVAYMQWSNQQNKKRHN